MRLRLASFNLESLDDAPDAAMPLEERLPVLRAALARLDADVVCLQEVNAQKRGAGPRSFDALDRLLEGTPYAGFGRAATTREDGGPRDVHNLVVLSRLPILAVAQVWHDLIPPPEWRWLSSSAEGGETSLRFERPLLHVQIDLGGPRPLHVVNLHLRAPIAAPVPGEKETARRWRSVGGWAEGFLLAAAKRAGQALEARLLVEGIFDDDAAALVALVGDFNAEGREVPLSLLRADVEDTGNESLRDRSMVALDGALPASDQFTVRHGGRNLMLDHVMVSQSLARACRGIEAHNADLVDELTAFRAGIEVAAGFHAPLLAEFELP